MGDEQIDDQSLLLAWSAGDQTAANVLLDRHFLSLLRFFRNKVGDSTEDLIQESMLECVRSLNGYEGHCSFRTFLFSIAHNVLKRHFARNARRARQSGPLPLGTQPGSRTSPSAELCRGQEQRLVLRALRRLSLDDQLILELKYWEDLNSAEIADVLDVPRGTVRRRQLQARARLAEVVQQLTDSPALATATTEGLETWIARMRHHAWPTHQEA